MKSILSNLKERDPEKLPLCKYIENKAHCSKTNPTAKIEIPVYNKESQMSFNLSAVNIYCSLSPYL